MKVCLVTGGEGFIGANIIRKLVKRGYQVHAFAYPGADLWRLHDVLSKIFLYDVDLIDFAHVAALVKTIKPALVFHLASFGGLPNQTDSHVIYRVNFDGTINLLEACKYVGFECFINTGSSSEYGMKNIAMSEEVALEPVSDYGVSKAAATQYCLKEALFNHLPVYTVRPFSVYGDYELATRLIPHIILRALAQKNLELSMLHSVRDFIYIDDLVNIYFALAQIKPKDYFVFNAGTGVQSSIDDVVATVEALFGRIFDIQWGKEQARPWEPKMWQADISRSHAVLGWEPHYSLEQGLKKSCDWFSQHLDMYSLEPRFEAKSQAPGQHVSL